MKATLFFIYNANSGILHGALDTLHKMVSPSTYPCKLCALTYGYFGKKEVWKNYLNELKRARFNLRFLHREELGEWPLNFSQLPAVYLLKNGKLELLASSNDLLMINHPDEFIELLNSRLNLVSTSANSKKALRIH